MNTLLRPLARRDLLALAGLSAVRVQAASPPDLVLSDFSTTPETVAPFARWRGFSDRVMGGVSLGRYEVAEVTGRRGLRMSGRVTRESGGGFIQLALDVGPESAAGGTARSSWRRTTSFDASAFAGVEFVVHGNDEDYNVHVRTADCGWFDQSYRLTFRAPARWETLRFPWSAFTGNDIDTPLDPSRLQRIAVLGWMREFDANLTVASVRLYGGGSP